MTHYDIKELAGVVVIFYISWAKGHGLRSKGKTFWCAEKDGDVVDYHLKSELIKRAKSKGEKYAVVRYHKDGRLSIVEKNY